MEDCDLSYNLSREEFENIISHLTSQFKENLMKFKEILDSKNIKFDDIEIIGGGTRIPII